MSIRQGVSSFLVPMDREARVPELHVDFFIKGGSMQLSCHFLNSDLRQILSGKDHRVVNMVFQIIGACTDCVTGFQINAKMTCVHSMYSVTVSKLS